MGILSKGPRQSVSEDLVGGPNESVSFHVFPDPLQVAADFGVDARLSGSITGDVTPGYDALQGTPADQRSSRITLWG